MDQAERDELLRKRAEREAAAAKADEAHRDLVLALEDKYITELGPRGVSFEIVNEENSGAEGPIVLKLPEATAVKAYMASATPTPMEDLFKYVKPSVLYPEATVFASLAVRRQLLLSRCVRALNDMAGGQARSVGKGY
jgi:hypothetical protein